MRGQPWTAEEDAAIAFGRGLGCTTTVIGQSIGRNRSEVLGRAFRMGLSNGATVHKAPARPRGGAPKKWTEERGAQIAQMRAAGDSWDKIADHFGVSVLTIIKHAADFGIYKSAGTKRRFSSADLSTLRNMYSRYVPVAEIAKRLERSEGSIRQQVRMMGLRRSGPITIAVRKHGKRILANQDPLRAAAEIEAKQRLGAIERRADRLWQRTAVVDEAIKLMDAVSRALSRDDAIRFGRECGLTLQCIGVHFGITRERVRQICEARR